MPFDAGPNSDPRQAHPEPYSEEPIDWLDWGLRIIVFGSLLGLYLFWIWRLFQPLVSALLER